MKEQRKRRLKWLRMREDQVKRLKWIDEITNEVKMRTKMAAKHQQ